MEPLRYESIGETDALSIQSVGENETVILVPTLPASHQRGLLVTLAVAALALLGTAAHFIFDIQRFGLNWTNGSNAFAALVSGTFGTVVFVLLIRDRNVTHQIHVTPEVLSVVRVSTSGLTTGDWTRSE